MKFKQALFAATLSVAIAFTLSCSSGGGDPADNPSSSSNGANGIIKKSRISGVFQKGPFIAGTAATLNELDNDLNPTGRPYQTLITDDKGSFELRNVELVSPYAHLIANGFYRNEITGKQSAAPITLQAVVDVTNKDNINVNILTHLEYYRVIDLVDGGMNVKAAKKQAQKEIFAVFGIDSDKFKDSEDMTIFGTSDADAALLAVSVLLLGDLSEADFSQRLMNLSQAIRTGGAWNDEAAKKAMAEWVTSARLVDIKSNILGWGLSSNVPNFEKFVKDYWIAYYCSEYDCFTDPRDGMTYRTITIRDTTIMIDWMKYRGEDGNLGENFTLRLCYYDNKTDCVDFKYYGYEDEVIHEDGQWTTAKEVCPEGWHLPGTESDFICACATKGILSSGTGEYLLSYGWGSIGCNKNNEYSLPSLIKLAYCIKDRPGVVY